MRCGGIEREREGGCAERMASFKLFIHSAWWSCASYWGTRARMPSHKSYPYTYYTVVPQSGRIRSGNISITLNDSRGRNGTPPKPIMAHDRTTSEAKRWFEIEKNHNAFFPFDFFSPPLLNGCHLNSINLCLPYTSLVIFQFTLSLVGWFVLMFSVCRVT